MTTIKRTVRVTIEREFEIELMPSMFAGMTEEQFLAEWRKGLWNIESIDDVVKYAAGLAANRQGGIEHDGIGLLDSGNYPRPPDVKFNEISDEIEIEVIA